MAGLTNKTALITGVAFLASDAARWITGASIPVDGGMSARPPARSRHVDQHHHARTQRGVAARNLPFNETR